MLAVGLHYLDWLCCEGKEPSPRRAADLESKGESQLPRIPTRRHDFGGVS